MKICVYGAGAIGGAVAARLAAAGREVAVIARGPHLDAIRARGLTLEAEDGDLRVAIPAADDPAALGPQDLVICTAKAHSLTQIARGIGPLLKAETPVAFALNGIPWWYFHAAGGAWDGARLETVDPGGEIGRRIGAQRALGCVVYMSTSTPAPGVVRQHSRGRFVLGEPGGASSQRLQLCAEAMAVEPFAVATTPRIRDEVFAKLLANIAVNPLCVLARSPVGGIAADPQVRRLSLALMAECQAVGAALGASPAVDMEQRLDSFCRNAALRPSTLQDLEAGRPLEIEALIGAVAELGRLTGTPTPFIDAVYGLTRLLARSVGQYPEPAAPA